MVHGSIVDKIYIMQSMKISKSLNSIFRLIRNLQFRIYLLNFNFEALYDFDLVLVGAWNCVRGFFSILCPHNFNELVNNY